MIWANSRPTCWLRQSCWRTSCQHSCISEKTSYLLVHHVRSLFSKIESFLVDKCGLRHSINICNRVLEDYLVLRYTVLSPKEAEVDNNPGVNARTSFAIAERVTMNLRMPWPLRRVRRDSGTTVSTYLVGSRDGNLRLAIFEWAERRQGIKKAKVLKEGPTHIGKGSLGAFSSCLFTASVHHWGLSVMSRAASM